MEKTPQGKIRHGREERFLRMSEINFIISSCPEGKEGHISRAETCQAGYTSPAAVENIVTIIPNYPKEKLHVSPGQAVNHKITKK